MQIRQARAILVSIAALMVPASIIVGASGCTILKTPLPPLQATPAPAKPAKLEAKPEAVTIDLQRTALMIIDMQNAFCKPGGMLDKKGQLNKDLVNRVIAVDQRVLKAARDAKMKIIHVRWGVRPDAADSGGPDSPGWIKQGASYITSDSWDAQIIDELKPEKGEIVVEKNSFNGFTNTNLDVILKTNNIKYIVFIGAYTNVCVESTLRDAFFHLYFPILVSDAVGALGPPYCQDATLFVVQALFGWVTTADNLIGILK